MSEQDKGRRSLKNLFVDEGMQKRFGAYIVAINFCVAGIGLYFLMNYVGDLRNVLEQMPSVASAFSEPMGKILVKIVSVAFITVIVTAAVSYLGGIYMAHKFAGPTKIIVESIDEMIAGKKISRAELRPTDELKEIFAKLKELDEKLHSK